MSAFDKVGPRRYVLSALGIIIMMGGTAVITRSGLGTAPVSSPVWVASLIGGLSFGGWTFALNLILIAAQRRLLKEAFPLRGWLQLPAVAVAGISLDGWMAVLAWLPTEYYWQQLLWVLVGVVILGLGVALLATSKALYLPGEGLVAAIAQVTGTPFARVKLIFDLCCVALAVLMAGVVLGEWTTIREATFISAGTLGFAVGFFIPKLTRIIRSA